MIIGLTSYSEYYRKVRVIPIDHPTLPQAVMEPTTYRQPLIQDTLPNGGDYSDHFHIEKSHVGSSLYCDAPLKGQYAFTADSNSLKISGWINSKEYTVLQTELKTIKNIDLPYLENFIIEGADGLFQNKVIKIGGPANFGANFLTINNLRLNQFTFIGRARNINMHQIDFDNNTACEFRAAQSINFTSCRFNDAKTIINSNSTGFENCNFSSGAKFETHTPSGNGIFPTHNIFIKTSEFRNANLILAHAIIEIHGLKLNSINTIETGDRITIDSLYGPGKLILVYLPYENRLYRRTDGKLYQSNFPVSVDLKNIDTAKLIVPDYGFNFWVNENQPIERQEKLYKYLLNRFANDKDARENYDINYQKFVNNVNQMTWLSWVQENWNYFGYRRNWIFMNSFYLMLIFFVINMFCFPNLIHKGYYIKEFAIAQRAIAIHHNNPWKRQFRQEINCLFYTFFVFWGLKLSIDNIRIYNIGYSLLIITEYITGVICLAYIANVVIVR